MFAMVATLAVASAIHFGVKAFGIDDSFPDAALPEAIIAAVVLLAALAAAVHLPHDWGLAVTATGFAIFGFVVGLRFTLFGRTVVAGDVAYHLAGLAALLVAMALLLASRHAPGWTLAGRAHESPGEYS